MVPPIKLCRKGHNICSKCSERVTCCPTCRARLSDTRNFALENIARRQKYPCANRQSGCLELFSVEHIAKHEAGCVYGEIKCPLHLLHGCSWKGVKNNLKGHVKAAHPKYLLNVSAFTSSNLSVDVGIVSCFGELFTCYQKVKNGILYCAVQLIGKNSEASKYTCEFTLRAANGIEQISKTFFVRDYSEDWETIFNSGICLCLDEKMVKYFRKENKVENLYTVKLSRV
jgi:hypothetical protein